MAIVHQSPIAHVRKWLSNCGKSTRQQVGSSGYWQSTAHDGMAGDAILMRCAEGRSAVRTRSKRKVYGVPLRAEAVLAQRRKQLGYRLVPMVR